MLSAINPNLAYAKVEHDGPREPLYHVGKDHLIRPDKATLNDIQITEPLFQDLKDRGWDIIPHMYVYSHLPEIVNQNRAFPTDQPEYIGISTRIRGQSLNSFMTDIASVGLDSRPPGLLHLIDNNLALQLAYCRSNFSQLDNRNFLHDVVGFRQFMITQPRDRIIMVDVSTIYTSRDAMIVLDNMNTVLKDMECVLNLHPRNPTIFRNSFPETGQELSFLATTLQRTNWRTLPESRFSLRSEATAYAKTVMLTLRGLLVKS